MGCRIGPCQIMGAALDTLASRFPATKFLRILSTDCIPGYPDMNVPTVLLYHAGKCLTTLVGLMPYGGRSTTPERAFLPEKPPPPHPPCGGHHHHQMRHTV